MEVFKNREQIHSPSSLKCTISYGTIAEWVGCETFVVNRVTHTGKLTNLGAWTSAMLLKMTSRHRGKMPGASGSPVMVYVFPELVIP